MFMFSVDLLGGSLTLGGVDMNIINKVYSTLINLISITKVFISIIIFSSDLCDLCDVAT